MSSNILIIFPADPSFVPSSDAQQQAVEVLRGWVGPADELGAETLDGVQFIHSGENSSGVDCPFCQADLDDWWGEAMDQAWDSSLDAFGDLSCVTPCCSKPTSLNELAYRWPVGFASFLLSATDPQSGNLSPEQVAQLEAILGCRVRVTWEHL